MLAPACRSSPTRCAAWCPRRRSRRTWKPNVHNKRLYSHILDSMVRLRVTAAALR